MPGLSQAAIQERVRRKNGPVVTGRSCGGLDIEDLDLQDAQVAGTCGDPGESHGS